MQEMETFLFVLHCNLKLVRMWAVLHSLLIVADSRNL